MIQHHLPYTFPDEDLMDALTKLYFENVNVFLPLLHRPRFERSIQEKLHLRDEGFATTLLLVCAVGSRWSNDPRVFLDGGMPNSCGWEWFAQVHVPRRSLLDPPTVYDLQYYSVRTLFDALNDCNDSNELARPALCSVYRRDFDTTYLLDNDWYWYETRPRCWCTSEETTEFQADAR